MAYRALTQVLLGADPPVEPGELVPETYRNQFGEPEPVDFERLVKLGAVEKDTPAKAKAAKAKAEDPPAEPDPEAPPAE